MEKPKLNYKKILLICAIFIAAVITTVVIYYYLYLNYGERVSERISDNIIVINDLFTSMYLVKTNDGYFAIDTGYYESTLEKGLKYNFILPGDVKAVLLTHSDFDHQGGIELLKHAKYYLSKEENNMILNKTRRLKFIPFISNSLKIDKYSLLNDNEEFYIGNRKIKCISLPGHTYGSMGYLVDDKYLFTGDAFRIKNGKLSLPYIKILAMNIDSMKYSLRKVAQLNGIKFIFSSHSGFTNDFDFAVSDWKK
ncbi:MAG: MBL fold metallo-hydrolase [Ignavibacteriales bacterium]|nr:MBL fold metallo-hydrolase [Ignavibacteriales bacterium]